MNFISHIQVKNLSKVSHENIIKLFGVSSHRNKVYIVMEFADCGSLYDLLHPTREVGCSLVCKGFLSEATFKCGSFYRSLCCTQTQY